MFFLTVDLLISIYVFDASVFIRWPMMIHFQKWTPLFADKNSLSG